MSYVFNPFTGNLDATAAGSATSPGGSDTQLQFNDGGAFAGNTALTFNKTTGVLTLTAAPLVLTGNISAASWGLTGLKLQGGTSTLTDTSAAGTVATGATNVLGGNTIAASNARTITNYFSTYINPPTAGTNVTLTNSWALGLAGAQSIAAGTFTAAQSALDITQTWNNAAVVFTGLKFNVTDTASSATSLLMDLQVGGVTKFSVRKNGLVYVRDEFYLQNGTGSQNFGYFSAGLFQVLDSGRFGWSASSNGGASGDLFLYRDAAGTLGQRNSTNAQESRIYATYTSASNYQRLGIKTAKTTLSNVTGASVTASSLIPAGAFLIGVTSRINTALGTGNGTTGYTVGTAGDADLWGAITGTAAGVASGSANYTAAGASGLFTSATDVIVTATGGNFDGTGVIELAIHYFLTEAD